MFTHLAHPLAKGETIRATFDFEHVGPITVEFPVLEVGAMAGGATKGGSMGGMKM